MKGLKKVGCQVVWQIDEYWHSLIKNSLTGDDCENFIIRKSIPYAECLAHPAVKCGLTNANWVEINDHINYGKPAITFPHFGD